MSFPGEEIVSTAVEKFSDGILRKMDESEARRNREFSYRMKELEFYKGNYDKEIKGIFDSWFSFLENSLLIGNKYLSVEQKKKIQKAVDDARKPDKALKLKIDTMKYGGTESGKALALFSQISYAINDGEECPKLALVYAACFLLSTLKHEILGQDIAPLTILQVLLSDYFAEIDSINEGRCYVEAKMNELFPNEQMI